MAAAHGGDRVGRGDGGEAGLLRQLPESGGAAAAGGILRQLLFSGDRDGDEAGGGGEGRVRGGGVDQGGEGAAGGGVSKVGGKGDGAGPVCAAVGVPDAVYIGVGETRVHGGGLRVGEPGSCCSGSGVECHSGRDCLLTATPANRGPAHDVVRQQSPSSGFATKLPNLKFFLN